jgi:hypothetical protein
LLIEKFRRISFETGAIDGQKKAIMKAFAVVSYQILTFSFYGFRLIAIFPELRLRL